MSNDKQQLATNVRQAVAELQALIDKVERVGLTVKLTPPNKYSLADTGKLEVEVWEKVTY